MNYHDIEKHALEKAAISWFIQQYNAARNKNYYLLCQQERPDALLANPDGQTIGLEIAHLFYDYQEAKLLLGRSEPVLHGVETLRRLICRLNQLIVKKHEVGSAYCWENPLLLLIRCASPVFTAEDFTDVHDYLEVPRGVYDEIWMLVRDSETQGWSHLIRLDRKENL